MENQSQAPSTLKLIIPQQIQSVGWALLTYEKRWLPTLTPMPTDDRWVVGIAQNVDG